MTARPVDLSIRFSGELRPLQVWTLAPGADGAAASYVAAEVFARVGVLVGVLTFGGGPMHSIEPSDGPAETLASLLVSVALLPEPNWIEHGPDLLDPAEALAGAVAALDDAANRLHRWASIALETEGKARGDGRRAWVVVDDGTATTVLEFKWRAGSWLISCPNGDSLYLLGENARLRLVTNLALAVAEPLQTLLPYIGTNEEPSSP